MSSIEPKAAIADHISYIPVKFKYLFGSFAQPENQAMFKVVKKSGTAYTDSEVKTAVSAKVNEYFDLNNWDFGDTFYFSELASYLHQQQDDYIASVVITPKFSTSGFTDLLSITSEPNEIFLSVASADVKIISAISQTTELQDGRCLTMNLDKLNFLPGHLKNSELETIFETTLERVFQSMEKVRAYVW